MVYKKHTISFRLDSNSCISQGLSQICHMDYREHNMIIRED